MGRSFLRGRLAAVARDISAAQYPQHGPPPAGGEHQFQQIVIGFAYIRGEAPAGSPRDCAAQQMEELLKKPVPLKAVE